MKLGPPIAITDATLISTNVAEGPAADWDAGTTYAAGDIRSHDTSRLKVQYVSLQGGNTNHPPGEAGSEAWWRAFAQASAQWDDEVEYAAKDGAQIDAGGDHLIYWSQVDANLNFPPAADAGDHWVKASATNRWAMFDQALGFGVGNVRIATRWPELIDVTFAPDEPLDTIVAFVLQAQSVKVTITDPDDVVLEDREIILAGDPARVKWQLDGVPHFREVPFEDLAFTEGSTVRVQIANPGGIAVCAELVPAKLIDAGRTQWGAKVGYVDYSDIKPDEFGVFDITKRAWHSTYNALVHVDPADVDPFKAFVLQHRGTPLLFIGQPDYGSAIVFGLCLSFEQVISWPGLTVATLGLESK
jgi:hypothetical protein